MYFFTETSVRESDKDYQRRQAKLGLRTDEERTTIQHLEVRPHAHTYTHKLINIKATWHMAY
jgi:hypothetical protein